MVKMEREYKFMDENKRMRVRPLLTKKIMQNQWDKIGGTEGKYSPVTLNLSQKGLSTNIKM